MRSLQILTHLKPDETANYINPITRVIHTQIVADAFLEESKEELVCDIEKFQKQQQLLAVAEESLKIEKKKVMEFQQLLCTTRALRFKDLHENEIQKVEINRQDENIVKYEKENILIRQDVINKIILIENAASLNAILSLTAKSQKEEIVRMCGIIMNLENINTSLKKNIRKSENALAEYINENNNLKHEVQEGKFLLNTINTNGKINGKINVKIDRYLKGKRFSGRDGHEEGSDDVIGSLSQSLSQPQSLFQPLSQSQPQSLFQPLSQSEPQSLLSSINFNECTHNYGEKSYQKQTNIKNNINQSLSLDMLSSQKSLFVGTGLGLRKNQMIKYSPKGSAKSMLKNILNDD